MSPKLLSLHHILRERPQLIDDISPTNTTVFTFSSFASFLAFSSLPLQSRYRTTGESQYSKQLSDLRTPNIHRQRRLLTDLAVRLRVEKLQQDTSYSQHVSSFTRLE